VEQRKAHPTLVNHYFSRIPRYTMAGLQPGERVPNFRRADSNGTAQVFYELHYGQPFVLAVLPDDESDLPRELEKALDHPLELWKDVSRLALKNGTPEEFGAYLDQRPLSFPLLADDRAVTSFLTGRDRQDRLVLFALDRNLRLLARLEPSDADELVRDLRMVFADQSFGEPELIRQPAPVLVLPRVFGASLCDELIDFFEQDGGHESGVLYLEEGQERWAPDPQTKVRRDVYIRDEATAAKIRDQLRQVLLPEIERSFQYQVARHEPFKLVRYGGDKPGYFRPHRDNVTRDAQHRRFAMTLNLNDPESYEGGQLRFPEHSPHLYQPPRGGAIVFSCSLVHEATPVTQGTRYALLGFFYH
jgi:predicted 2-oxoglutarate/Fe(II)-dependent dioxygenase YbiX